MNDNEHYMAMLQINYMDMLKFTNVASSFVVSSRDAKYFKYVYTCIPSPFPNI